MRALRSISFICLLAGFVLASHGQSTLQRRPAPGYTLGAGDQISIQVVDLDNLPSKPLQIDPDGDIDLPLIGRVHAAGLTIAELKSDLVTKLSRFITTPEISINLAQNQSTPVTVTGAVNSPSVHQLDGPRHLLEMISLSGGIRADAGDLVIVTRQPGRPPLVYSGKVELDGGYGKAKFSVDDLLASKHPQDNILVEPGDEISIPKAELISVVGNVKRSGRFPLSTHTSMSVLDALALAEGTSPHASPASAHILRASAGDGPRIQIPVDVKKILAGKAPDQPLYANDILYIPNSPATMITERALEAAIGVATGLVIYGGR